MKFKTKIKISFAIIIIVPIILILAISVFILNIHIRDVEDKYGIDNVSPFGLANQNKIYNKLTQNVYKEIVERISNDAQQLMNTEYLAGLNNELSDKYSFIIAKKNDKVIFNGCETTEHDLADKLPNYRGDYEYPGSYEGNTYIYGDYKYLIKQLTFELNTDIDAYEKNAHNYHAENEYNIAHSDNSSIGTIYIVTIMRSTIPRIKKIILQIVFTVILTVILTGCILGVWIQRSIMRPLNKLTDATKKIAQGDLNFTLERTGPDEFGDLCEDFENMRKILKESAQERIIYDEESKELISNISHDLKTPITAIKGYVEGIMDGVANTPEKMDRYIKTIYNKANDMDKLIGELTLYSKIDTNTIPYNFEKVNVDEYFSDCVEEISVELEAKNIVLTYANYVDTDTVIIADPEQMKRVINNIISNSVKYIGNKKGAVNIRINDENDFIHVEIEDNGKGINQKELPYIFDRFYRTDASRNSNQGGSGIGLAIVKKIIDVHGGKIWATSRERTGTIMHFILRKYYEPEVVADYEQNIDN